MHIVELHPVMPSGITLPGVPAAPGTGGEPTVLPFPPPPRRKPSFETPRLDAVARRLAAGNARDLTYAAILVGGMIALLAPLFG